VDARERRDIGAHLAFKQNDELFDACERAIAANLELTDFRRQPCDGHALDRAGLRGPRTADGLFFFQGSDSSGNFKSLTPHARHAEAKAKLNHGSPRGKLRDERECMR
jgi:hypothetical protein